jgi:hypothetical protein
MLENLCEIHGPMNCKVMITDSLLKALSEGIGSRVFMPVFGEVHLGVLNGNDNAFGRGVPHYGMVRGPAKGRPDMPLIPFAPMTSDRCHGRGVLKIPKGEMPPKKGEGLVDTYVLLKFRAIRIPWSRVRDSFRFTRRLRDCYLDEARRIIRELRAR